MAMLDPTRDFITPSLSNKRFEGYVIDTADPDKRQRVKVRIPVLHRGIPDSELPWVNIESGGQHNAGAGVGSVNVPTKGSKVNINFLEDDPHNPQYSSSPASDDVNKENELLEEDYPHTYGQIDSHGNRVSTNKATGDMTVSHKSGAIIHIDGSGNVSIVAAADLNLAAKGNINLAAKGNITVGAKGDITADGARVLWNSGTSKNANVPGKRAEPQVPDHSGKTDL